LWPLGRPLICLEAALWVGRAVGGQYTTSNNNIAKTPGAKGHKLNASTLPGPGVCEEIAVGDAVGLSDFDESMTWPQFWGKDPRGKDRRAAAKKHRRCAAAILPRVADSRRGARRERLLREGVEGNPGPARLGAASEDGVPMSYMTVLAIDFLQRRVADLDEIGLVDAVEAALMKFGALAWVIGLDAWEHEALLECCRGSRRVSRGMRAYHALLAAGCPVRLVQAEMMAHRAKPLPAMAGAEPYDMLPPYSHYDVTRLLAERDLEMREGVYRYDRMYYAFVEANPQVFGDHFVTGLELYGNGPPMSSCRTGWVRDLVADGDVESNPGPAAQRIRKK